MGIRRTVWVALAATLAPGLARAQSVALLYVGPETMAFEDVPGVPGASDNDYNDVALRWTARCEVAVGDGRLAGLTLGLVGLASGAAQANDLGYLPPGSPLAVRIHRGVPDFTHPEAVGPGQAVAPGAGGSVTLVAPFASVFAGAPAGFVNTEEGSPLVAGEPFVVEVDYAPGAGPVVAACPVPELKVLGPAGRTVGLYDTAGPNHQPLAGTFPDGFAPPWERVFLGDAYPGFLPWVEDVADGTCDTACDGTPWWDLPETGAAIDVAGLLAEAPLPLLPTCTDGEQNQDEEGTDCGGAACGPCGPVVMAQNSQGVTDTSSIQTSERFGQPFVPSVSGGVQTVTVTMSRNGTAAVDAVVDIYAAAGGKPADGSAPLGSSSPVPQGDLPQYPATAAVTFTFPTPPQVTAGATYAWVVRSSAPLSPYRIDVWRAEDVIPGVARVLSVDGGATWISAGNGGDHAGWSVVGGP